MMIAHNKTSPRKGEVGPQARVGIDRAFSRISNSTAIARKLRGNMTEAEQKLWRHLRNKQLNGVAFRRQHPIGRYVVDFWCPALKLAIEVDGGQHGTDQGREKDYSRTVLLESKGATVIRFWNNEVIENIGGVLETVQAEVRKLDLSNPTPTPTLPLAGGGSDITSPSKGEVGAKRRVGFALEVDR